MGPLWSNTALSPIFPQERMVQAVGPLRWWRQRKSSDKSISDLISTIITEGAKVPGGHGVALTSNIIRLVPNLPLNPVLAPCIDLPPEKECKITLGDTPRPIPAGHGTPSSLPSSPLTGGTGVPMSTGRSTIRFGQAMI